MGEFFRAGVGIILRDPLTGQVLVFERADLPGAWQYPQGGIDKGEAPVDAAWRELGEEVGLGPATARLTAEHPTWTSYELPPRARSAKTGIGQTQRWFVFEVDRDRLPIVLDGGPSTEFRDWRWTSPAGAAAETVWFRQDTYRQLARWLDSPGPAGG